MDERDQAPSLRFILVSPSVWANLAGGISGQGQTLPSADYPCHDEPATLQNLGKSRHFDRQGEGEARRVGLPDKVGRLSWVCGPSGVSPGKYLSLSPPFCCFNPVAIYFPARLPRSPHTARQSPHGDIVCDRVPLHALLPSDSKECGPLGEGALNLTRCGIHETPHPRPRAPRRRSTERNSQLGLFTPPFSSRGSVRGTHADSEGEGAIRLTS